MGQAKPFKFKFPDGRDPRVKKRALSSVLAFLFLLLLFSVNQDIQEPSTCGMCHVMVPHYRTWEASAHQRVDCVTCHREPGLEGAIKFQISLVEMAYNFATNKYYLPIAIRGGMSAEPCNNCHALNRDVSASGGLIVPHKSHEKMRVNCLECHKGVVHANIAARQLTLAGDKQMWTTAFSRKQMAFEYRNLTMKECMDCHTFRRVETGCSACHKDIDIPETHYEDSFATMHGYLAYEDLLGCDRCHSWTRGKVDDPQRMLYGEHPVREYSRNNKFCYTCHLQRPEGHDDIWRATHADIGREGRYGCYVCHDFNKARLDVRKGITFSSVHCSQCHVRRHGRGRWRRTHPTDVVNKRFSYECLSCHSEFNCGQCHLIYQ